MEVRSYTVRMPIVQIGDIILFTEQKKESCWEDGKPLGDNRVVERRMDGMLKVRSLESYDDLYDAMLSGETFDVSAYSPMLAGQCWCTGICKVNEVAMEKGVLAHADLRFTGEVKFQ